MELFPAVCSECRRDCEVPFRPTGDKPVYCRDCFSKQRHVPGRNSNGADGPRADFRRDALPQREHQTEYAGSSELPRRTRSQNDGGIDALRRQLDSLESKLDHILALVSKKPEVSASETPIVKVATQVAKTTKTKASAREVATKRKK